MVKVEAKYVLEENRVSREMKVGDRNNHEPKSLTPFLFGLGQRVPVDLGWIPPGLRSYTQAGNHAQFVLECPPGVNHINWGEHERGSYETYLLAQPWRIIICDLYQGNLLGARMFYSPVPFTSPEQRLYHANIPNLNCKGYRDVSIGWLCLYHRESWEGWSLGRKAIRIAERCSGVEAYNNANMRDTDGPRFYKGKNAPKYLWDPKAWEKKTEEEGFEWTLDADLWIPIQVRSRDSQDQHYEGQDAEFLTLDMAMNGTYKAYYGDKHPKPALDIRRGHQPGNLFKSCVVETFNNPPKIHITLPPEEVKVSCGNCGDLIMDTITVPTLGEVCQSCYEMLNFCVACGEPVTGEGATLNDEIYCPSCVDFCLCNVCGLGIVEPHMEIEIGCYCDGCADEHHVGPCELCLSGDQLQKVVNQFDEPKFICHNCMSSTLMCGSCGELHQKDKVVTTKTMEIVCENCFMQCAECGYPVMEKAVNEEGLCPDCQQTDDNE